jgi:hypothetical protein
MLRKIVYRQPPFRLGPLLVPFHRFEDKTGNEAISTYRYISDCHRSGVARSYGLGPSESVRRKSTHFMLPVEPGVL